MTEYLDIPDAYVERAQSRYESVGRWLGREESKVSDFGPNIFPQGSFSLGTAIRPVSDEDDYDVDLVCKIQLSKSAISQKQLKELIGNELVEYVDTYHMASPAQEYRRSWRLDYADQDVSFHLDVLPAIPALDFSIEESVKLPNFIPSLSGDFRHVGQHIEKGISFPRLREGGQCCILPSIPQ